MRISRSVGKIHLLQMFSMHIGQLNHRHHNDRRPMPYLKALSRCAWATTILAEVEVWICYLARLFNLLQIMCWLCFFDWILNFYYFLAPQSCSMDKLAVLHTIEGQYIHVCCHACISFGWSNGAAVARSACNQRIGGSRLGEGILI